MKKILLFLLVKDHKRRPVDVVIWLLRLLRDVETAEMWRNSDLLDKFDTGGERVSQSEYNAVEERYMYCEYAVSVLESVIEDLEFTY